MYRTGYIKQTTMPDHALLFFSKGTYPFASNFYGHFDFFGSYKMAQPQNLESWNLQNSFLVATILTKKGKTVIFTLYSFIPLIRMQF